MGSESRCSWVVETRRLLLVMGVVFGMALLVQYFELPYSNIFSSLFVPGKFQPNVADEVSGRHTNFTRGFGLENVDTDPQDEAATDDSVDMNLSENVPKSGNASERVGEVNSSISGPPPLFPSPENRHTSSIVNVNSSTPVTSLWKISNNGKVKEGLNGSSPAVVTISEMNGMQLRSRVSYTAAKPKWSSPADRELLNAQTLIKNAPNRENEPHFDVSLYRNFSEFQRSYELMEKTLKVYIYSEGEQPIFHRPTLHGIYASEGWFMKHLKSNKRFVTKNPKKAHLFYLPFSTRALEVTLYVPNSHNRKPLIKALNNYIELISKKYHFWNRTGGSDHFLVACHDWAPSETREIMPNCIRSLCNSDIREGFQFGKDASLPETNVRTPKNPVRELGGKPPSKRRFLAFFAGRMHGYLRPILLKYWENKDPDMKIFGEIRNVKGQMKYEQYMKSSKYCICAKGFEVNSPRVVEAIFYECVPVIISDYFVPAFLETLNWESFTVFVLERDIPNLKNILLSIPKKRYEKMQKRVKEVQKHFLWHSKPVKYDIFHMILHSVWYNRVFQARHW